MNKLFVLSLLALANCAASGPQYNGSAQPHDGQAKIVLYRESNYFNYLSTFWLEFNGQEVCDIHNASYMTKNVQPGQLTIASSRFGLPGTSRLTVDVKAGQTVYVKMEVNNDKMLSSIFGGLAGAGTAEAISNHAGPVWLGLVTKEKANIEMQGFNQDCQ